MNWMVRGVEKYKVGFQQEGNDCEGGHCEHLKKGDVSYGYSGEADSWGREVYLMCEPCYVDFLTKCKVEPTECNDCQQEFPRNTLYRYIPYIMDGSPSENEDSKLWVCKDCQGKFRHLNRLQRDKEARVLDNDDEDFDCDPSWRSEDFEEDDNVKATAEEVKEMIASGHYAEQTYYWDRKRASNDLTRKHFSHCIKSITVVDKLYHCY